MDNKKKEIADKVFKIILIIIIILLLLRNCKLMKDKNNERIPTGNVEIIEINCDKEDTCEVTSVDKYDDSKNNTTGKNDLKPSTNPTPSATPTSEDGELVVEDNDITWSGETAAKIFTNSMYEFEDKIAPESGNTYQFIVKNSTKYTLKYTISLTEDNPYNINMKYKLKKNDTYIISDYVSASEVNVSDAILNSSNNDTYYLEWKWISSSNDTEIGINPDAKYGLRIEVKAESIDG